jgi:hypothetical protein
MSWRMWRIEARDVLRGLVMKPYKEEGDSHKAVQGSTSVCVMCCCCSAQS